MLYPCAYRTESTDYCDTGSLIVIDQGISAHHISDMFVILYISSVHCSTGFACACNPSVIDGSLARGGPLDRMRDVVLWGRARTCGFEWTSIASPSGIGV